MGSPTPLPPSGGGTTPLPPSGPTTPLTPTTPTTPPATPVDPPDVLEASDVPATTSLFNLSDLENGRININTAWLVAQSNELDLKADLHEIEFTNADVSRKFSLDALSQLGNVIALFNNLLLNFLSANLTQGVLGAPTQAVNTTADPMNTALDNHAPAAETYNTSADTYNTAANDFNTQLAAGFPSPAARDAAITAYNDEVNTYNAAVNAYNISANATNVEINAYNAEVAIYNAQVPTANAQITAENAQRALDGLEPLPLQTVLPTQDLVEVKTTLATLPLGVDPAGPVPTVTQVTVPPVTTPLINPVGASFEEDYLATFFYPFALPTLGYVTTFDRLWDELLDQQSDRFLRDQEGVTDITRPEAFIHPQETGGITVDASGRIGLASKALGLDGGEMEAIISQGLFEDMFKDFNAGPPTSLPERLQTFTLSFVIRNALRGAIPGLAFLGNDLASLNLESPDVRLALSLGAASSSLGILKSNDLQNQVGILVDDLPGIDKLGPEERKNLNESLGAVLALEATKLSVQSLAVESGSSELLNSLEAGLIVNNPNAAESRFSLVQDSFAALLSTQGTDGVTVPLSELIALDLSGSGIGGTESERLANLVSGQIGDRGIPASRSELEALAQGATNNVLGAGTDPAIASQIADSISVFGIAGATREALQDSLIRDLGPLEALEQTDQIIQRLFGFSIDFADSSIIQREKEERGANNVVRAVEEHIEVLRGQEDNAVAEAVAEEFDQVHESTTQLKKLLSEIIDPGQLFFGVMYEGAHGSAFERGDVDIRL